MKKFIILFLAIPLIFLSCRLTTDNLVNKSQAEHSEKTVTTTNTYMSITVNGITSDSMIGRYNIEGWKHGLWEYYYEGEVFSRDYFFDGHQLQGVDTIKVKDITFNTPLTTQYSSPN